MQSTCTLLVYFVIIQGVVSNESNNILNMYRLFLLFNLFFSYVSMVCFRDGEQYNVYRVVDRGDGTLTPLSDSLR